MFAPTALVAGVGLWHMVHQVKENQKYVEKIESIKQNDRKQKIANGLEMYKQLLEQDPFVTIPSSSPKLELPPLEEPKTEYAVSAFVMAAICGTLSQTDLHGVSWVMITPVTVVAILTVILALSKSL